MPGPGWYPDPQDSASVRWFDGDDWTEHRAPADPTPEAESISAADETIITAGVPSYASAPAAYGEDPYDPYSSGGTSNTSVLAPVAAGASAGPGAGGAPAAPGQLPPAEPPPVARGSHAAGGRARLDRRLLAIVVATVVVVALLVVGAIFLFTGGTANSFTYQGKSITKAAASLQAAETNLNAIVNARHGATNGATHCYYSIPVNPAGAKKTDIDQSIRCGPVLFVDGSASKPYLSFAFTTAPSGGSVIVTPKSAPISASPDGVPTNMMLKRPDGKKPPVGAGGLVPPVPPAAQPNVLTSAVVTPPAGTTPITAIVGSLTGGITITDQGKVTRFGSGDDARTAPDGQVLYAFKIAGAAGNSGPVNDLSSATTISVDGATGKPLPSGVSAGQSIVIAVPTSTKSLDLVLTDSGIKQTFSLISGKPGATNVQVLARKNRSATVSQTQSATYNYSTKVVFTDHSTGTTQTASIVLAGVTLVYRDDVNAVSASAVDKAFLIPDIVYTGSHDGGPYGIDTSLLTFTPGTGASAGAAITAKNISTDPSKIRNVFEVPADVTTGTLTVGGTATETFSGGPGTYTLTVAAPISFPVSIPAG